MNSARKSTRILSSSITALLAIPLIGALSPTVQAVDRVWGTNLGAGPHVWNTGTNWIGGTAPTVNADRGDLRKDWSAAATINFNAATTINGILFDDIGVSGDVGVTLGGSAVTLAGTTPVIQVDGSTLSITNVIAGNTAWSKTGAGTLVLSAANTSTGNLTLSAGVLRGTTVAGALGAGGLILAGGNLQLANNGNVNFGRNTTVSGNVTITADRLAAAGTTTTHTLGTLSIGAQTLSINRGANITGTAVGGITFGTTTMTAASTFDPQANTTLTVGGIFGGAFGFTKTGGGTLVLSGASTHTGDTTLANGLLQIANNSGAGNGAIVFSPAATTSNRLLINGGVTIANALNIGATVGTVGAGVVQQTGTGQATVNGPLTITGGPSAGGHFVGGGAVGNELVIGGPIFSSVSLSQRSGRVIYKGGGSFSGVNPTLVVTGSAIVGATNGLATNLNVSLGGSESAALELNGFDQTLAGLTLGNAGNNFNATVNLGSKTLTLTGNVNLITGGGFTGNHVINATTGTLALGSTAKTFTVTDNLAASDLTINGGNITGTGGLIKNGAGALALNNVNITGPLTIDEGTLQAGSFTSGALAFSANPTALQMKVGIGGDTVNTGALTAAGLGTTSVFVTQVGGELPLGNATLINYTGASPGVGGFTLAALPGRLQGTLVDTGSSIALNVISNDRVVWTGANGPTWSEGATANWKLFSNSAVDDYLAGDVVVFANAPTSTTVDIPSNVSPSHVTFANTVAGATDYTVTGFAGITGPTGLTKSGDGRVTLITSNAYTGPTAVNAGTLELDHDAPTNVVLSGTSVVDVATPATLALTRDDGAFTFNRNLTGTGTVTVNPHSVAGSLTAYNVTLSGSNTGFIGNLILSTPASGTYRIGGVTPTQLGSASITVEDGAQIFTAANGVYNNLITITGTGYADSAGNIGALRLESGSNWTGPVNINAAARIGAHNTTATVSGSISGGDLEVNATNFNNSYTLIFTGANTYGTTTIGGQNTQTAGQPSMRLNIGNGGTTGTLGSGPVIIHGDGANGVLGFDRSNGYTLLPGQTITASNGAGTIANSIARTFIDFDTLGAGFNDNGNAITLGSALLASGGQFRVGQARANAVATFSGALTGGVLRIGSGQGNATVNLNSGAVANFERIHAGLAGANTTSVLNINSGATVNVDYMTGGEASNVAGIINQATGTTVNVASQLRLGHFGNETSTYNMSGGTLTLTGPTPNLTPSTGTAGAANATGDNNINALATPAIVGGGIYLGIDGTGIFNHTGGTVTTNWIVLDNRGDSAGGVNQPDGVDRYNLSGAGSVLNLRSSYGLIARNASTAVSFGGGTVRVDNSGTGVNTGANLTIPLDATIDTVASTSTTLDTNGATNGFTLNRDVRGSGTLDLTGGGTINLSPAATQVITAGLSGSASLVKSGTATTTISGSSAGYTGAITISQGTLVVPNNIAASSITIADNAVLGGEPTVGAATFGSATRADLIINPNTAGALTAANLTVPAGTVNQISLSEVPTGAGPWTAINYTSKSGTGTFDVLDATSYRVAPVVTDTGSSIRVNITGTKPLLWTGTGAAIDAWDTNITTNWQDAGAAPDNFFSGDTVVFGDGPSSTNVNIAATGVTPWKTTVNSDSNNYTINAISAGIKGPGNLEKSGFSTLTLTGANSYSGKTIISSGTLAAPNGASLGDGSPTNSIVIEGGGRLTFNSAAAHSLGGRDITIGAGGGIISHNNATAVAITIPGRITGTEPLVFQSNAAGAGTFILAGDNSGYNGPITVDSTTSGANGLTILRFANQSAVPAGGSITVNYPTTGATGNATSLDLNSVTLPNSITLNLTSALSGTVSLRSQLLSAGSSVINSPIVASGNSIVQVTPTGSITLNGPVTDGGFFGTLFLRNTGTVIVNGSINLPSAIVSRTDAGLAILNSTGNLWSSTAVVVGTLRMGVADALPASAALSLGQNDANTATLDLNGFNQTASSLASNPTVVNANSVGKSITSATPATLAIEQFTNTTYSSLLTGEVSLEKRGSGRLTLLGANTHNGNTNILDGVLAIGNRTALGTGSGGTSVASGGTLELQGSINVVGEALSIAGPGAAGSSGALVSASGSNFYNGAIALAADATIAALPGSVLNLNGGIDKSGATLTFTGAGSINIHSVPITGAPGAGGVIVDGVNVGINVPSTYAGPTVVKGTGLLVNGTNQALPTGTSVTLGDALTNSDGTWFLSGTSQTIAELATEGTGNKLITLGGGNLKVDQATDSVYSGSITGPGVLEKTGAGTLDLIASGGALDFSTLSGNGGTVDLHSALGTGSSTITATAEVNLAVTQVLASLDIGDGGVVTLGSLPPPAPAEFGAAFIGEEIAGGAQAVPEPGSAMLVLSGLASLLGLRRRNR